MLSWFQLFATPWTLACQASLSITNSWSLLKLMSIELVMSSNHLILLPSVFSASRSFPLSWLFASAGQSIGASASVPPMNIQGLFPLKLAGLISLQSKGFSRIFSSTTVEKQQFFGASLLYYPTLTPIAMTRWTFVGKVMSLHFNTLSRFVTAFLPRSKCLLTMLKLHNLLFSARG